MIIQLILHEPKTSPNYLKTYINVIRLRNKSSHFLKETTVPDTLEIYCTENNIKEEEKVETANIFLKFSFLWHICTYSRL